jgi:hypothetical protein
MAPKRKAAKRKGAVRRLRRKIAKIVAVASAVAVKVSDVRDRYRGFQKALRRG